MMRHEDFSTSDPLLDRINHTSINDISNELRGLQLENERMTAELAAERERNRWIAISERLPEKRQPVLVMTKNNHYFEWWTFGDKTETYGWSDGSTAYELDTVTHWRPIVPPTEKGGE